MSERNEDPAGLGINGVIPGGGRCVVAGCDHDIPEDSLMCSPHWRLVAPGLQENLAYMLGRWRRGRGNLGELREAQWVCVESVGVSDEG